MSQQTLVGPVMHGAKGDPLERHYTSMPLADAVVQWVKERVSYSPRLVLEPHVGGGSFVRAIHKTWPDALVTGIDIDERAEGLRLCNVPVKGDFIELCGPDDAAQVDLIIGNPPFSTAPDHVWTALSMRPKAVAFVLPMGVVEAERGWTELLAEFPPELVKPIRGRHFGGHCRCVGVWVWGRGRNGAYRIDPVKLEVGP